MEFVEQLSGDILRIEAAPGGGLMYFVNGADPRPPFRQLSFVADERWLDFIDINRGCELPEADIGRLLRRLREMADAHGVTHNLGGVVESALPPASPRRQRRPHHLVEALEFVEALEGDVLRIEPCEGGLRYFVNRVDPRPAFRHIEYDSTDGWIDFVDIERGCMLPETRRPQLLQVLQRLCDANGVKHNISRPRPPAICVSGDPGSPRRPAPPKSPCHQAPAAAPLQSTRGLTQTRADSCMVMMVRGTQSIGRWGLPPPYFVCLSVHCTLSSFPEPTRTHHMMCIYGDI